MKKDWFQKNTWFYMPKSFEGYVIAFLFVVFLIQVFSVVDQASHSASDTFYGIFPYFVPAFLLYNYIASKLSK